MSKLVTTIAALREALAVHRRAGGHIGMVPTMGALHEGHLSLVREARSRADAVVVSIFVNPTQFAPHEDFDAYPRTLDADLEKLGTQADIVFTPTVREMYPEGHATSLSVAGPSAGLETDFRPHFFSGVATVVAKLLIAALPDIAMFGEKDYQQLLVVKRLARDLALPVEIVGAPTLREADGLALSSRNAYLSADERKIAGELNVWGCGFSHVDYVAIRDAESLDHITRLERPARILAAAKIGKTRLIDNMAV